MMKLAQIGAALVLCLALSAGAVAAQENPGIAPIQSRPHGQTKVCVIMAPCEY